MSCQVVCNEVVNSLPEILIGRLGVHIGQAVPAELVEEPLALEVVYDHGNELRVPSTSPRASRPARSRASPRARRRRRARGESGRRPAWKPGDHHGKEAERPCRDRLGYGRQRQ